jgi:hypothetical protein
MSDIDKEQFDEWCFDFSVDLHRMIADELEKHGITDHITLDTDVKIGHFTNHVNFKLLEILEQKVVPPEGVD